MQKLLSALILLILAIFLSACGSSNQNQEDDTEASDQAAEVPQVEVNFKEQPLPVKKETTIQAVVTQGGEAVVDAQYVKFEIWRNAEGKASSTKTKAEHQANGKYEIKHTFEAPGTYQVIAHTQVEDLHTMPQVEVKVGAESDDSKSKPEKTSKDHGHGKFMVSLMTDQTFTAGEESKLITHINRMETPFEDAKVRFEISSKQMENHKYIDAKETQAGEYVATHTFPSSGNYTIKVHYEKPDKEIHGHQEKTIEVTK